jgi:hypothetical protein
MKPELRAQWCKALRSGDYEQVSSYLRVGPNAGEEHGYCCLGVLLDIEGSEDDKAQHAFDDDYSLACLTGTFSSVVGLSRSTATELADMNDDKGMSFDEIADWIEDNSI